MSVGIRKSVRSERIVWKVLGAPLLVIALLGGSFTAASASSVALPKGTIGIGDVKSKPVADTLKVEDKLVVDESATTPPSLLTPATKVPAPVVVEPAPVVVSAPAAPVAEVASAASPDGWSSARVSWYGPGFYGNTTASGKVLETTSMFVAHRTLPFGTRIEFSYNGVTAIGVVEDRGPYSGGREFDLGPGLASALGFGGVDSVSYRIL